MRQHGAEYIDSYTEADLTADGVAEALVIGGFGMHGRLVAIFSGSLAIFTTFGDNASLVPQSGGFQLLQPFRLKDEGSCCPSWFYFAAYEWRGSEFELSRVDVRHFSQLNNVAPPAGAAVDEIAAVLRYYARIAAGQFAAAYELLSRRFQLENPGGSWLQGFSNSAGVSIWDISARPGPTPIIAVAFEAADRGPDGGLSRTKFAGTWELRFEDGSWKLDRAAIEALPPGPWPP